MTNDIMPTPQIPLELLRGFDASYQNILGKLSQLMTDDKLRVIAQADYKYKEEECFQELKKIVISQKTPKKVSYILGECLELTRWTNAKTEEEHLIRAFSTMLLLILQAVSDYECINDENETLITLLESITKIKTAEKATQELLIWRVLNDYEEEKAIYLADENDKHYVNEITVKDFFIYALLLLLVFNQEKEEVITEVVDWVLDTEKFWQNMEPFHYERPVNPIIHQEKAEPLLVSIIGSDSLRKELWLNLTQKMRQWKSNLYREAIDKKLDMIIDCILNDKVMKF